MRSIHCPRVFSCVGLSLLIAGLTTPAFAEEPVNLGSAADFGALAASTVTNVPEVGTIVTGHLGVSPGTAVTGFPPGQVLGTIYAGGTVAAQAQDDLTDAYNDAVGRTGAAPLSGDLDGLTLGPGLYASTSSLEISGELTLDAQGDPNAVFIFQIGSTLTAASDSQVILIGGANACRIFWQVGSSATLGTASVFNGNILAFTSITLTTGATLNGRALALNGAVTLDSNTVIACAGDVLRVDLLGFEAHAAGVGSPVTLTWETAAEFDNAGFNIYRAADGEPRQKLNAFPISAQGTETEGAVYTFVDNAPLESGETRGYYLEEMELSGTATLYGPVQVGSFTSGRSVVPDWSLYK